MKRTKKKAAIKKPLRKTGKKSTRLKGKQKALTILNTTPKSVVVTPGPQALQEFLKKNGELLNLAEMERLCGLPNGTLRHIRTGKRLATWKQYAGIQTHVMPELTVLIFILQNYSHDFIERPIPL